MKRSLAVTYHEHGSPAEKLRAEEVDLPEMGPDTVRVKLLAAVIHPSDFGMIQGSYGILPSLPAIAGREGVGEVVEVGNDVEALRPGDWVRMPDTGAWCAFSVAPAASLMPLPNDIPVELAAMASINPPTAWRILRDAHLSAGEWIIQNAANSAVGQYAIQMARSLDLKTLNVVRRQELVEPLKAMGADVVVLEESGYEKKLAELTGGASIRLGLNSVGGQSALRLARCLGYGAKLVTFGAMSFEPVRFPTRQLIFNNITLTGFWLDRWYKENSRERIQVMNDRLFQMMRDGTLEASVEARFPLSRIAEAVEAATQPRFGKVLLTPG